MTNQDPRNLIPVPKSPDASKPGRFNGMNPCVVCGREVKRERYMVHLCGGGGQLAITDDCTGTAYEPECLAGYAIGTECVKKVPAEYVTDLKAK